MQGNEIWIALFRRIPADLHDNLSLGLTTGVEIVTQRILKLEPDFMITRGRLAGTTDPGRIIMIPYTQLTHVSILRVLGEAEVEAIFGQADMPPMTGAAPPTDATASASAPPAELATVNDPSQAVNLAKKKDAPSKTILLAKLRDRLNAKK